MELHDAIIQGRVVARVLKLMCLFSSTDMLNHFVCHRVVLIFQNSRVPLNRDEHFVEQIFFENRRSSWLNDTSIALLEPRTDSTAETRPVHSLQNEWLEDAVLIIEEVVPILELPPTSLLPVILAVWLQKNVRSSPDFIVKPPTTWHVGYLENERSREELWLILGKHKLTLLNETAMVANDHDVDWHFEAIPNVLGVQFILHAELEKVISVDFRQWSSNSAHLVAH